MIKQLEPGNNYLVGVLSDTHGRIPSGVPRVFKNVDLIIHAGDIGDEKVLDKLSKISPVVAVRGNMDYGSWTDKFQESKIIKIGQIALVVLHIASRLDTDTNNTEIKAVISGHTHRPDVYERKGVTFVNPGSASYPKFGQPASVALIQVKGTTFDVKLIHLKN